MWYMNCFKSYVKCLTFFSLMKYLHSVLKVSAFCPYNGRPFKAIMGFAYAKNVTQCPNAHAHVSIFKGIIHAQNVSLKWNKTQYTIRNTQWTMDMQMNQNAVKSLVCLVDFAIHLFRPMKHLSVHSLNQEYFQRKNWCAKNKIASFEIPTAQLTAQFTLNLNGGNVMKWLISNEDMVNNVC